MKLRALPLEPDSGIERGRASRLTLENLARFSGFTYNAQGFPCISEEAFRSFQNSIPHLFRTGLVVLNNIEMLEARSTSDDTLGALAVLRSLVLNAAVCAPTDLWLLRHVLSLHAHVGVLRYFLDGRIVDTVTFSRGRGFEPRQLSADLEFLHARGYLDRIGKSGYALSASSRARSVFTYMTQKASTEGAHDVNPKNSVLPLEESADSRYCGEEIACQELDNEVRSPQDPSFRMLPRDRALGGWIAGPLDIELGYRLVPLTLGLLAKNLALLPIEKGMRIWNSVSDLTEGGLKTLFFCGLVNADTRTTSIGVRVFTRARGPFGIIHSYRPFFEAGASRLALSKRPGAPLQVLRDENVAASQEANAKTFKHANDALDSFCTQLNFKYTVFIEHALGLAEATRQRWQRDRAQARAEATLYVGADLEIPPVERARTLQRAGHLPPNMLLIDGVDIGNPQTLLTRLRAEEVCCRGAIMMVGNGFHEIRNQTNEGMARTFQTYASAGIILIFAEESALTSDELRASGWNTYHAGFRYVHQLSGQGLRPAIRKPGMPETWRACAERGGYIVLDEFTKCARGIRPCAVAENTPISVTYFCVPAGLF